MQSLHEDTLQQSPWWIRVLAFFGFPTIVASAFMWGFYQFAMLAWNEHSQVLTVHVRDNSERILELQKMHLSVAKEHAEILFFLHTLCERMEDLPTGKYKRLPCTYQGGN